MHIEIPKIRRLAVFTSVLGLAGCLDLSGVGSGDSSGQPVTQSTPSAAPSIKPLSAASVVSTLAGAPANYANLDGQGSAAGFKYTEQVAIDSDGNVYVADQVGGVVRKITPQGLATTLAGDGAYHSVPADGVGAGAQFCYPSGIAVDSAKNVYVSDCGYYIRKISPAGVVTTLAGADVPFGSTATDVDGPAASARFSDAGHLAFDSQDNLYVANGSCVRKMTPSGMVSTVAGQCGTRGVVDGPVASARFEGAFGIAIDDLGNIFISEDSKQVVRKISTQGMVTTIAGSSGVKGSVDGVGGAALFAGTEGLAVDSFGNVLVADTYNDTIRMISPAGQVTTIAGAASPTYTPGGNGGPNVGNAGFVDGPGSTARFYFPVGLVFDKSGNLFVSDRNNHAIRKISAQ